MVALNTHDQSNEEQKKVESSFKDLFQRKFTASDLKIQPVDENVIHEFNKPLVNEPPNKEYFKGKLDGEKDDISDRNFLFQSFGEEDLSNLKESVVIDSKKNVDGWMHLNI